MKPQQPNIQLAAKLKTWRATHKLPLKIVAADLNIRESTWQRWEEGTRVPTAEYLHVLADYLKMPACWLLYDCTADCNTCQHSGRQWYKAGILGLPTGNK